MQTLKFTINKQVIKWENQCRKPVEKSKGVVYAQFTFDEEWDGLKPTIVFDNDFANKPVGVIWTGDPIQVPPEVLVQGRLRVSAIGFGDGGKTRLTTKRMEPPIMVCQSGPVETVAPEDATPELWEQVLAIIGPLSDLETFDKSSLVAAINEAYRTGGGGGTGGGGLPFELDGKTLIVENGVLRVNTANKAEQDNTLPITSAAVHTTVGNIELLLSRI